MRRWAWWNDAFGSNVDITPPFLTKAIVPLLGVQSASQLSGSKNSPFPVGSPIQFVVITGPGHVCAREMELEAANTTMNTPIRSGCDPDLFFMISSHLIRFSGVNLVTLFIFLSENLWIRRWPPAVGGARRARSMR
jgi:hypothetical protein